MSAEQHQSQAGAQPFPRLVKGAPWNGPVDHDPAGAFNRTVRGRPCRKLRTSRVLRLAVVEYEDGSRETVPFSLLRTRT